MLCACNVGHVSCANYEDFLNVFLPFGDIEDVVLVPNKSYSFVMFVEISSATRAYEALNGEIVSSLAQGLYLSFVQDIPKGIIRNNWKLCQSFPEGLQVVKHFVSEEEEDNIINGLDWKEEDKDNVLKNRQVRHFGKEFIYGSNTIASSTETMPFPLTWTPILQRSIDQGFQNRWPDQCTVNRYVPGSGIPQHTDNHNCCDDTILALSLGSDIIMNFTDLENHSPPQSVSILLPQRSLMVMTGRSRYAFTHGITSRKSDIYLDSNTNKLLCRARRERISLTFRKSISEACICPFPKNCPNQSKTQTMIGDENANKLEKLHVHQVYEKIGNVLL